MTLSKKTMNAQVMDANAQLFRCPICAATMEMVEQSRLVCVDNHSFDLSKNGYVNLAPQAHLTKYDRSLFDARKIIMMSSYFDPVIEAIATTLQSEMDAVILDAGCGEGTHLAGILAKLPGHPIGVGVDLAKEGVATAAKFYPGIIWGVADLANCPFQREQFDAILNILSPANYAEFTRVLKPGGRVLKVVPEKGYLKELRAVFYGQESEREEVEEADAATRFAVHFDDVSTQRITYRFPLSDGLLAPLVRMTPLSWGAGVEKVEEVLRLDIPEITVDFTILSGVKRG